MNRPRLKALLLNCYPRWSPVMFKVTLGGALAMAVILPLVLVALPFIEFFNGMAAQSKGKAEMTYGRTFGQALLVERAPVPGTVPQHYEAYPFQNVGNTIDDAKKVGVQLKNPLPMTMEILKRGQNRYNIFCIACHGKMAEGDGPVATGGENRFPAPPSLHTVAARGYADGTIFHIITKGMGKMPSYADKLSPEDRWSVIHYVRVLQRAMNPTPKDLRQP